MFGQCRILLKFLHIHITAIVNILDKHVYSDRIHTFFWEMCSKYNVKSDLSSDSTSESILDTTRKGGTENTY